MAGRRQSRDIDDVFDADRHTMQRPASAASGDLGLGGLCRITVEPDKDVQLWIEPANTLQ
jgi:hypothetical protein